VALKILKNKKRLYK
jgi:dual specificity tyrosine-phosphorylation-regulated kinase 2/3/4